MNITFLKKHVFRYFVLTFSMNAWSDTFEFYVEGVLLFITAVLGVLGNIVFIVIFSCGRNKINTFHRWCFIVINSHSFHYLQSDGLLGLFWHCLPHLLPGHLLLAHPLASGGHLLPLHPLHHNLTSYSSYWAQWWIEMNGSVKLQHPLLQAPFSWPWALH